MNSELIMKNLLELCAVPSISDSDGERAMSQKLREMLLCIPYFVQHPSQIEIFPIENDPKGGTYLFALMRCRREQAKTLLLLSHFDVVGVEEYGAAQALAFDPARYTGYLKTGAISLPAQAKADLESGNFLFGRGTCDMKWGIAADLELLRWFSEHPEQLGVNLLMVSVPDEERNSIGMLSAAKRLLSYREENRLTYTCCLVGEPDISPEQGGSAKKMHVGAAGKLMPLFYCAGKETHVGEPFCGLNPNLLLSEITARMELSADFIDSDRGCYTPAPTCLKQSDLKTAYSVQTPCAAYAYYNVMTITHTPEQLLRLMEQTARDAFADTLRRIEEKHAGAEKKLGRAVRRDVFTPKVMRYGDLFRLCEQAHGKTFTAHMEQFLEQSAETDLRLLTVELIREAHSFCPDRDPMVILCFAPPYYPHSGFIEEDSPTIRACRALAKEAENFGETFATDYCFNGLTDMSYLSLRGDVDTAALRKSFPVWGVRYSVPLEEIRALDIPFINFGPLGRDPHKFTERVDLAYSFGKAPELLLRLVRLLSE